MPGFFVTGTDTGVGKTHVAAALARRVHELGRKVFAFKPIETGCIDRSGELIGEDQEILSTAAGGWQSGPLRGLYRFRRPAAPYVAATAESSSIDLSRITAIIARTQHDFLIVEAAGGWRVPITEHHDTSELARVVDLPVIVVARAGLGTINHSLLTVEAVERDGLQIASVVLSRRPDESLEFAAENAQQIHQRWPKPVLVFDENTADQLLRFT